MPAPEDGLSVRAVRVGRSGASDRTLAGAITGRGCIDQRHLPGHGVAEQTATDRQGEDPEVVDEHEHAFETLAYVSRTTSTGS